MNTYCDLRGDQITLVQDEDKVLVWGFLFEIFLDRTTASSKRIASVQDV